MQLQLPPELVPNNVKPEEVIEIWKRIRKVTEGEATNT
jgi:hypothetical protein